MTFGEFIKHRRKEILEQSLRVVSKNTGISYGQLSDIETGKQTNPTMKTFCKLYRYYGLNPLHAFELLAVDHDNEL